MLIEERAFERRTEFLEMNPAGTTPVFTEEQVGVVPGASIIAEYLDETRGLALGDRRMLPSDPGGRDRGATAGRLVQRQVVRRGERAISSPRRCSSAT